MRLCLEVNLLVDGRGREDIVADAHVVHKNALQFGGLGWGAEDFVFLESLQIVRIEISHDLIKPRLGFCDLSGDHLLAFFLRGARGSGGLLGFFDFFGVVGRRGSGRGLRRRASAARLGALGGRALLRGRRLGLGRGHGHLLVQLNVFAVDEVDRVGVNDSRVIRLALNFEIVRYEVDWSLGVLEVMGFVGRVAEVAVAALVLVAVEVAAAALVELVVAPPALVAAAAVVLVAAVVAAVVLVAATVLLPLLRPAVVLLPVTAALESAVVAPHVEMRLLLHVLLVLMPGLLAALVATLVELVLVLLVRVALPAALTLVVLLLAVLLIIIARVEVVLLIVLHSWLISKV